MLTERVIIERIKAIIDGNIIGKTKEDLEAVPLEMYLEILQKLTNNQNSFITSNQIQGPLKYVNKDQIIELVRNFFGTINSEYKNYFDELLKKGMIHISPDELGNYVQEDIHIKSNQDITDGFTLAHEFTHMIQRELQKVYYDKNFDIKNFIELQAIVFEWLFIDYLKDNNYSEIEIERCKNFRAETLIESLTKTILIQFLYRQIKENQDININDIYVKLLSYGVHINIIKKCIDDLINKKTEVETFANSKHLFATILASVIHNSNNSLDEMISTSKKIKNFDDYNKFIGELPEPIANYVVSEFSKEISISKSM